MVKNRPALSNTYVKYILKMLGVSNTLNTSNRKIYSKKVKDFTMNNEQVALYDQFGHLRDYTGIGTLLLVILERCLRYSPLFCKGKKLVYQFTIFYDVCKVLKRKLDLYRCLAYYHTSTLKDTAHFCEDKNGQDKLDPN